MEKKKEIIMRIYAIIYLNKSTDLLRVLVKNNWIN